MSWRRGDIVYFNQSYPHVSTAPNALAVVLDYSPAKPGNEAGLVEVHEILRDKTYRCFEYRVTKIGELQDA